MINNIENNFVIFSLITLFIYLWLCWVFLAVREPALTSERAGAALWSGLLIAVTSLVAENGL